MERFLRTEQDTLKLRLIAALGAAAALYFHQGQLSLFSALFLSLVYILYVAYSLTLRYFLLPKFGSFYLIYGMIVVDTIALTGIIYVSGGINSALIILFPVFIIYYSIHLGYLGSYFAATIATLSLGAYVLLSAPDLASERALGLEIAMFYIAATFSGYLGQRNIREQIEKETLLELLNVESGAKTLLDVATTLNRTLDLEVLLQDIAYLSPRITGLSKCVAMLLDERSGKLVGKGANFDVKELGLKRIDELVEIPGERSLPRRAWEMGQPIPISNIKDHIGSLPPASPELKAESLLVIPLIAQGRPLGVIYCYEDEIPHTFTDGEISLSKGFGDLTAMAIENARLYQEAQEKIAALVGELSSAVQRIERRREPRRKVVISVNGLQIDAATQKVTLMGKPVALSPTEFRLLQALAENAGMPVSHDILFRKTWGDVFRGQTNVVDVYIHRLRRKLEENALSPKRILTVRGVGYKLSESN